MIAFINHYCHLICSCSLNYVQSIIIIIELDFHCLLNGIVTNFYYYFNNCGIISSLNNYLLPTAKCHELLQIFLYSIIYTVYNKITVLISEVFHMFSYFVTGKVEISTLSLFRVFF